jgi:type IV secretory pathway VirB2 component (pilin)
MSFDGSFWRVLRMAGGVYAGSVAGFIFAGSLSLAGSLYASTVFRVPSGLTVERVVVPALIVGAVLGGLLGWRRASRLPRPVSEQVTPAAEGSAPAWRATAWRLLITGALASLAAPVPWLLARASDLDPAAVAAPLSVGVVMASPTALTLWWLRPWSRSLTGGRLGQYVAGSSRLSRIVAVVITVAVGAMAVVGVSDWHPALFLLIGAPLALLLQISNVAAVLVFFGTRR